MRRNGGAALKLSWEVTCGTQKGFRVSSGSPVTHLLGGVGEVIIDGSWSGRFFFPTLMPQLCSLLTSNLRPTGKPHVHLTLVHGAGRHPDAEAGLLGVQVRPLG